MPSHGSLCLPDRAPATRAPRPAPRRPPRPAALRCGTSCALIARASPQNPSKGSVAPLWFLMTTLGHQPLRTQMHVARGGRGSPATASEPELGFRTRGRWEPCSAGGDRCPRRSGSRVTDSCGPARLCRDRGSRQRLLLHLCPAYYTDRTEQGCQLAGYPRVSEEPRTCWTCDPAASKGRC